MGVGGAAAFIVFVVAVAACGTGGTAGLDSKNNPFLSSEDPPPEGSEQAAGVSSEDEAQPTSGEDDTRCPPCPVKCAVPATVTVTTTDTSGDGGQGNGQTQTTTTENVSISFKSRLDDGSCGSTDKDLTVALQCGGRVTISSIPGSVVGTWNDLGAGNFQLCLNVKSVLDEPECFACTAEEGSSQTTPIGGGDGGTTRFDAGGGGFDASAFDAAGFDAGIPVFDAGFGTD